jgi:pyruvate/2-oxoglutarate dehydrogenase complex dihydrolipoamide acyltransferase (E2) component
LLTFLFVGGDAKPASASSAAPAAAAPAAAAAPKPAPAAAAPPVKGFFVESWEKLFADHGLAGAALFSELNKGGDITSGLKVRDGRRRGGRT